MHYEPSSITAAQHQSCASKLTVGQRLIPHVFVRAADARPYNIHDVLPSDTRFKVLVFAGNTADAAQAARVEALAGALAKPDGFLARFGRGAPEKVFDILSISSAKKQDVNYTGEHARTGSWCADSNGDGVTPFDRSPKTAETALVEVSARSAWRVSCMSLTALAQGAPGRHGHVRARRRGRVRRLRH